MAYVHHWNLKSDSFTQEFLDDVAEVILEHINILNDIEIRSDYIKFNGKPGNRCGTFFFHKNNYHNYVKTGRFVVEDYDLPVTVILLLGIYHLDLELKSDGLATLSVDIEKKSVSRFFEVAIAYVKNKFGYSFNREHYIDEFKQDRIRLLPLKTVF